MPTLPPPSSFLPFLLFCAGALGLITPALRGDEPLALRPGEQMTFQVSWGIFAHAGDIVIAAADAPGNPPELLVTTTTTTRGMLHMFYSFEAMGRAFFDPASGRLLRAEESSQSDSKRTGESLVFDYASRTARYANTVQPARDRLLTLPPGDPLDLIMSLIQTRNWTLQPGETRDALVIFDDEFYELTLHAVRYEELHTRLGDFRTLLLVPKMEKTAPKGMFKRGSEVKVWISQDERRLPVRFQVEFKFGTGIATLVDYRPPPALPPAPANADAMHPRP